MGLLPTSAEGVPDDVTQRVDKAIERAAATHTGYKVVSANDMIPRLGEAQSLGIKCKSKEVECLIKLGILLEIDHLISSTVAAGGNNDRFAVEAVWIDVRAGREAGRVRSLVDKGGASFESGVADVVNSLLDSTLPPARLQVTVSEEGAEVRIDGEVIGTTPLSGKTELPPGPHKVTVSKPGKQTVQRDVLIAAGQPMLLDIFMASEGGGGGGGGGRGNAGPVLLWSGVGGLAVGSLVAIGAGLGAFAMESVLVNPQTPVADRYGAKTTGQALVFTAGAGLVVAAVGAGLVGLSFATD